MTSELLRAAGPASVIQEAGSRELKVNPSDRRVEEAQEVASQGNGKQEIVKRKMKCASLLAREELVQLFGNAQALGRVRTFTSAKH